MSSLTKRIAVVANPAGAAEESEQLRRLLNDRAVEAAWFDTTPDDPGVGQTRRAIEQGADTVLACGGDGTVRACLEAAAGTDTAIAILPAGTGNLLARNLGVPTDPDEAFDVAISGVPKAIDLGIANEEAFAVMAGIGLDARIMRDTERQAKERFGVGAYVASTFRHLRDEPFEARVTFDGDMVWAGRASSILIGNHGELQGGVSLFPDASATDSRLDLLITTASGPVDWLRTAWALLMGRDDRTRLERGTAEHIVVEARSPVPYEIDGEERDAVQRVEIRLQPLASNVMIPEDRP